MVLVNFLVAKNRMLNEVKIDFTLEDKKKNL